MFNQIIKNRKKDTEEEVKKKIGSYANQILQDFIKAELSIAEINDILTTVRNHIDISLLSLKSEEIFKKKDENK